MIHIIPQTTTTTRFLKIKMYCRGLALIGLPLYTKRMTAPFLRVLAGEVCTPPPIWLMRQAGRYLPEYRALRTQKGGFLELLYDSDAAAEVTLQPIRRFGFDAAILFSDILVTPQALGQNLRFTAGEGPELSPPLAQARLEDLHSDPEILKPIYDTVRKVRAALPQNVGLIGFAGAPWTVATYMVAGAGSRDLAAARLMAHTEPGRFAELIAAITTVTIDYLRRQADAGAQALMLFDSWSGPLSASQFERQVIAPTAKIVAALRESHTDVPFIGFPRGGGVRLPAYARETGVTALALDESIPALWAAQHLPDHLPLQGNIDPLALLAGGDALRSAVREVKDAFAGRPHIFNLGHGIIKETPISHVEELVRLVRT